MSHFTEVKTQIKNREHLKTRIKELGFEAVSENAEIVNFYGDHTKVDLMIKTGTRYDVGLRLTAEGTYEFVADWELLRKMKFDVDDFQRKLQQKYSYITIKDSLSQQGFEVDEELVNEDGSIQMVVGKW